MCKNSFIFIKLRRRCQLRISTGMDLSKKPFVCTGPGCKKEFSTEDHLDVHMKKHNLALDCSSKCQNVSGADQTPTPTRFIRNCEDLGLFQDLQNVNPFDETFGKAMELVENSSPVEFAKAEGTLHTPQLVSQTIKNQNISKIFDFKNSHSVRNGKSLAKNNKTCHYAESGISLDGNLDILSNDEHDGHQQIRIERHREMNRAAQERSRAKKKVMFDQMVSYSDKLVQDNKMLVKENNALKRYVKYLQTVLSFHNNCSASKDLTIRDKAKHLIRKSRKDLKRRSGSMNKIYKPILPNNNTSGLHQRNSLLLPKPSQDLRGTQDSVTASNKTSITCNTLYQTTANIIELELPCNNKGLYAFGTPLILKTSLSNPLGKGQIEVVQKD